MKLKDFLEDEGLDPLGKMFELLSEKGKGSNYLSILVDKDLNVVNGGGAYAYKIVISMSTCEL